MHVPEHNPRNVVASRAQRLRFGTFEVDLRNRELRNRGIRIRLQAKPFRILELLLERSGELVTRDELIQQLWPGLHVNFEQSLNTAVNSLREALGDSSRSCRFIETRSGLGYRFVAHVEQITAIDLGLPGFTTHIASRTFGVYEDYLKGRHFYEKMSEDDLRRSVAHFESAIRQDSTYAPAYAGLADSYTLFAFFGMLAPAEAGRKAKELAARAVQIDGALPEIRAASASVMTSFGWDWTSAELECQRSLELNPNYAEGHHRFAALLCRLGRMQEAIQRICRAQELNPVSMAISMQAGWIFCMARQFEAAVDQCWNALSVEPKFAPAQYTLGLAYGQLGMVDEALTEFENARTCSGNNPVAAAALSHAYASAGRPSESRAILHELGKMSEQRYVSCYWKAMIWIGLREYDRALNEIENACRDGDVWLTWLSVEPRFDPIRSHERFTRVLKQIGLSHARSKGHANRG